MSHPDTVDVMDRLEQAIARLADDAAPLDQLIAAHQEALKLLDEAEAELAQLRARASELTGPLQA